MFEQVRTALDHQSSKRTPEVCRYLTFSGSNVPRKTVACSNAMVGAKIWRICETSCAMCSDSDQGLLMSLRE